ncbi:30S ribosomal protein S5 [Candidatus Dependentiae bacterium]|nr:30S ribosomal protein S5 [Candidatus Dependentiae bacterium]
MAQERKEKVFVDSVVSVRRVTKVTKGGKRFSFSAFVVSGDQEGSVGIGTGSSREVSSAIAKATTKARRSMFSIPVRSTTIPYDVMGKHGASRVILKSACKGTGVIAGGAVRAIMKAAGVEDILAKSLGSSNKQNVVKATLNALAKLRTLNQMTKLRGKTAKEIMKGSHVSA